MLGVCIGVPRAMAEVSKFEGAFTQTIPIEVPPFHGIEPKLALNYHSGGGNGLVGVGWSVTGFSSIERRSEGRGTPKWRDTDVFLLDGQELMPCTTFGGTHCGKNQTYQRIAFDAAANTWSVTEKDGTKATYTAIFLYPGIPAMTSRWGISTVTDTSGNTVQYNWLCDGSSDCYPDTVTYNGIQVTLFREARPDTISFATGWGLAQTRFRLRSVFVYIPGVSHVRAYKLGYRTSAVTSRSVLASVQVYGRDVTHDGAGFITGGTALPATTFTQSNPPTGFTADQTWASGQGWGTSAHMWMADVSGDGKEDVVYESGGYVKVKVATGTSFLPDQIWAGGQIGGAGYMWVVDVDYDGKADVVCQIGGSTIVKRSTGTSFKADSVWASGQGYGSAAYMWMADVNGDGTTDIVYQTGSTTKVKLSTGSSFLPDQTWATGGYGGAGYMWVADIDNDGKADVVFQSGGSTIVKRSTGTSFQSDSIWTTGGYGSAGYMWMADVNGDGSADVVFQSGGSTVVKLATGYSFLADQTWASGQGSGGADYMWMADVNADGNADIVYQSAGSTKVKLSTGYSFLPDQLWATGGYGGAGYMWMADVNGDGVSDVVYQTSGSTVVKVAKPAAPDLVVAARNGLGGTTDITYVPSSTWPSYYATPISQTVAAVVVSDGRGGSSKTSYSYVDAFYDRAERAHRGFYRVKAMLPCAGETTCHPDTWAGPFEEWRFRQDSGSAGQPYDVRRFTGSGVLLTETSWGYETSGSVMPYTSLTTDEWTTLYDATGASRRSRVSWTFDGYANVTSETKHGDTAVTGDESTVVYEYSPDASAYIVSRATAITSYAGVAASGTPLAKTLISYDGAGRAVRTERWLDTKGGYVTQSATYDGYGNVVSATDGTGATTTYTFDGVHHQRITSVTDALGQTTSFGWDPVCAARTSVTGADGQTTTIAYDALCRPVRKSMPLGAFEAWSYVSLGTPGSQYVQVETPSADGSGNQWVRAYPDGLGRTWRTESKGPGAGRNIRVDVYFGARGQVLRRSAPYFGGDVPAYDGFGYDALDRVTQVSHADRSSATRSYGVASVTTTDENRHSTTDFLDAHGRVTTHREHLDGVSYDTTSTYDAAGRLVQRRDPAGNVWSYSYDSLGRKTRQDDPDAGAWTYAYDAAGRVTMQVDAKGQTTTFAYDALDRLKAKRTLAGTAQESVVTFEHDPLGRVTRMVDAAGAQTLAYDALGRIVESTRTIDGVAYRIEKDYDAGGRLLWTRYSAPFDTDSVGTPTAPLRYDGAGRLTEIPGIVSSAEYDASGRLTRQTNANGTVTQRTYSAARPWLLTLTTTRGTTTLQSLAYSRDAEGQITRITSPVAYEGWSYAYDELHRLTAATNTTSPAESQTFGYDALGNLFWNSRVGSYAYPAAGQPRPHAAMWAGENDYSYDQNGNLVAGGGRNITWDGENQPVVVNGTVITYDGAGQRIKQVRAGTSGDRTTHYLGDDYEVTGTAVTRYVELGGAKVAKRVGTQTFWLHTDHQGSIHVVTDEDGNEVQRLKYRPYGERLETTTTFVESLGYTGQRQDDTGLFYLHARYYDPVLARFVSPDPIVPSRLNVGLNRYAYAGNDPIDHVDVDGYSWVSRKLKKVRSKTKQFVHWAETRKPLPTNTRWSFVNNLGKHLNGSYGKLAGIGLRYNPLYLASGDLKGHTVATVQAAVIGASYAQGGWLLVALEAAGIPYVGPGAEDLDRPQTGLANDEPNPSDGLEPENAPTTTIGVLDEKEMEKVSNEFIESLKDYAIGEIAEKLIPGAGAVLTAIDLGEAAMVVGKMQKEQACSACAKAWGPPKKDTIGPRTAPFGSEARAPEGDFYFGSCGACYNKDRLKY